VCRVRCLRCDITHAVLLIAYLFLSVCTTRATSARPAVVNSVVAIATGEMRYWCARRNSRNATGQETGAWVVCFQKDSTDRCCVPAARAPKCRFHDNDACRAPRWERRLFSN
jgi:hypothetical protein